MSEIDNNPDDLKGRLTSEQYRVTQGCGTEAPFSGKYYYCDDDGIYKCICCGNELFKSDTKFESGTGWPSFYAPIEESNIRTKTDDSHGMSRVEILCGKCDSHLGHVFPDGPQPKGNRYCVNSAALELQRD